MPATETHPAHTIHEEYQQQKHTQHTPSMKMEWDYLYSWMENGCIHKTLTNNGEPKRPTWGTEAGKRKIKHKENWRRPDLVNNDCLKAQVQEQQLKQGFHMSLVVDVWYQQDGPVVLQHNGTATGSSYTLSVSMGTVKSPHTNPKHTHAHMHTHTHTHTHTYTHTHTNTHIHTHSLSLSHTERCKHAHTHTHPPRFHTYLSPLTHTQSLSLSPLSVSSLSLLSLSLSLSHTNTHMHNHTHIHTHTDTHTQTHTHLELFGGYLQLGIDDVVLMVSMIPSPLLHTQHKPSLSISNTHPHTLRSLVGICSWV